MQFCVCVKESHDISIFSMITKEIQIHKIKDHLITLKQLKHRFLLKPSPRINTIFFNLSPTQLAKPLLGKFSSLSALKSQSKMNCKDKVEKKTEDNEEDNHEEEEDMKKIKELEEKVGIIL